jgi:lipopolysaccharide/colanic/teichoic acid biosynthesis glycosyltransferase
MTYIAPSSDAETASDGPRFRPYRAGGKRLLDLALVLVSLPFAALILLPVILLVRRDGSPAFYRQTRVGRNGREFEILKIRTMVPDADAVLARLCAEDPAIRAEWRRNQKLADDPRITPVGRFLRRASIDELPQLLNVAKGDMSLIGPRPMTVDQKALYPGSAYYALRPGITGPWQVAARHATSFAERAVYDTAYAREMSLLADVKLLFRTVAVVLRCKGA